MSKTTTTLLKLSHASSHSHVVVTQLIRFADRLADRFTGGWRGAGRRSRGVAGGWCKRSKGVELDLLVGRSNDTMRCRRVLGPVRWGQEILQATIGGLGVRVHVRTEFVAR